VTSTPSTYQLIIRLSEDACIAFGALGEHRLPAGDYVYIGSARRNMAFRIKRHYNKQKKLHWHIDYLLTLEQANIIGVHLLHDPECTANQNLSGKILVPGLGASDCRAGCISHFKYIAPLGLERSAAILQTSPWRSE
jgi:Uri superfamily endonuclease